MTNTIIGSQRIGLLEVKVWEDRAALGAAAADAIAAAIRQRLDAQKTVRIVFAAAPSQHETLAALAVAPGIEWGRVDAFHMDEYVGIPRDAPQRFGNWLRAEFFDALQLRSVELIDPDSSASPEAEAARYGNLVSAAPIDIVLSGIGANGHLAFNDPPADFDTHDTVTIVELDRKSRAQQVEEGLFADMDAVPTHALTLTIPCLMSAHQIFCMASGELKREAVTRVLSGEVAPDSPASILRTHPDARLFLDRKVYSDV